jgi:hypothetical protein
MPDCQHPLDAPGAGWQSLAGAVVIQAIGDLARIRHRRRAVEFLQGPDLARFLEAAGVNIPVDEVRQAIARRRTATTLRNAM